MNRSFLGVLFGFGLFFSSFSFARGECPRITPTVAPDSNGYSWREGLDVTFDVSTCVPVNSGCSGLADFYVDGTYKSSGTSVSFTGVLGQQKVSWYWLPDPNPGCNYAGIGGIDQRIWLAKRPTTEITNVGTCQLDDPKYGSRHVELSAVYSADPLYKAWIAWFILNSGVGGIANLSDDGTRVSWVTNRAGSARLKAIVPVDPLTDELGRHTVPLGQLYVPEVQVSCPAFPPVIEKANVSLGSTVFVDANSSIVVEAVDPEGNSISGYSWTIISAPSGSTLNSGNGNPSSGFYINPDKPGDYEIAVTAIDTGGLVSAPYYLTFTAAPAGPSSPTIHDLSASPSVLLVTQGGGSVSLSATINATCSSHELDWVSWYATDSNGANLPINSSFNAPSSTASFTPTAPGPFTITVSAKCKYGSSSSATTSINAIQVGELTADPENGMSATPINFLLKTTGGEAPAQIQASWSILDSKGIVVCDSCVQKNPNNIFEATWNPSCGEFFGQVVVSDLTGAFVQRRTNFKVNPDINEKNTIPFSYRLPTIIRPPWKTNHSLPFFK